MKRAFRLSVLTMVKEAARAGAVAHLCMALSMGAVAGCAGVGRRADTDLPVTEKTSPVPEKRASELRPNYLALAEELIGRGFYQVALANLKEAEAGHADKARLFFLMGVCQRELGRYRQAERNFKRAIALDRGFAPAYDGLGLVFDMKREHEKARAAYRKAISINPARADFYNNLGYSLLLSDDPLGAKGYFAKALAVSPEFEKALNNMALCHVMLGEHKEALGTLKKIYSLDIAYNNLGVMYYLEQDWDKARAMYGKALEINPGFRSAARNLALLRTRKKGVGR
ncbi:MAG: tetratricopeptide repeat protein [Deltaproteobacteria bacterium]|nr:tetratricopeptide repeat protein [Deltaproteobacteria bacterium]